MNKVKVDIVGGAGYTGGEMIRLLLHHPHCRLNKVTSRSQSGKQLYEVHPDLKGWTDLKFEDGYNSDADITFLCMGHGKSKEYLQKNSPHGIIIDLSRDFRLKEEGNDWVYGLCELNKENVKTSNHIANPGCFASCIQLGLLPLAANQQLTSDIHITAITGSTGAGQKPVTTTHNSWRNNNISIYKAFNHQHLDEIKQSIVQLDSGFNQEIHFIPMRGSFTRGIFTSMYLASSLSTEEAIDMYNKFYAASPFVHISSTALSVKEVVNTNNTYIYLEQIDGLLRIESTLDNLIKGAAGQAIQNMNIRMGWPEEEGLKLKGTAF